MAQQIKSNNKNNSKDVGIPLKLAFQANIFKYVQKKKRQFSIFSALKQNSSHQNEKSPSNSSSNLIKQASAFNFYQPNHKNTLDSQLLLSARIKLIDRKLSQKGSILKRKIKGHKSTLSDWRMLYDERQGIAEKHQMKHKSPDKMAATDRLFYPSRRQSSSVIEKNCERHHEKQHIAKDEIYPNEKDRFFVSDENFFHMYHRSVTPIASDHVEKKRIAKYLRQNKERRESTNGLRLMNEGIFSELSKNDVAFVPYKFQSSGKKSKINPDLEQNFSYQIERNPKFVSKRSDSITESKQSKHIEKLNEWNRTQIKKFTNLPKASDNQVFEENKRRSSQEQNPEQAYLNSNKQVGEKNHVNLSQLFCKPQNSQFMRKEEITELKLRLFKPRLNKIQKAISNTRKAQSENRFANFQYTVNSTQSRKSSLSTTKHTQNKWTK